MSFETNNNTQVTKKIASTNNPGRTILKVVNNKDMSSLSSNHNKDHALSKKKQRNMDNNNVKKNYEQKYMDDDDENTKDNLGEGDTIKKDDTFLTGVPVAPSPIPPKSVTVKDEEQTSVKNTTNGLTKIEERLNVVNDTQASLRAELEAYVNEVRGRTGEDGERLVEFPENFDSDVEKDAKREAGWRKFISSQVLEHPNEEEQRKMKRMMENGLERIQKLDAKLEEAELKYLESKNKLKGKEDEIEKLKSRWGGEKISFDDNVVVKNDDITTSADGEAIVTSRVDEINKRSAVLGRQVLLTEDEEQRVANIMQDMMDDIKNEVNMELGNDTAKLEETVVENLTKQPVHIEPNAYCPVESEEEELVELETRLLNHQGSREHAAPTGLVFDERRGTYILVDPQNVNAEKTKREESLKSNDVLADMRRKRMKKVKLEQIESALEALKTAPIIPVDSNTSVTTTTTTTTTTTPMKRGRKKKSPNKSSRQPTSLRAILKPVSPRQIETVIKIAKSEVDTIVEKEIIDKLVEDAKLKIEIEKESDNNNNNTPRNPPDNNKNNDNDNEDSSSYKNRKKHSPSLDDGRIKNVKVREKKSNNSRNRNSNRQKKKKGNMKKSASTGITSIKVEPAFEGKYNADEDGNMNTSKSSSGAVFAWSRSTKERYTQGNKPKRMRSRTGKKK